MIEAKKEHLSTLIFYTLRTVKDTKNKLVVDEVSEMVLYYRLALTPKEVKMIKRTLQHNECWKSLVDCL